MRCVNVDAMRFVYLVGYRVTCTYDTAYIHVLHDGLVRSGGEKWRNTGGINKVLVGVSLGSGLTAVCCMVYPYFLV